MDNMVQKKLEGFEAVWKRVQAGNGKLPQGLKLMPRRSAQSAAVRFNPQGRKA